MRGDTRFTIATAPNRNSLHWQQSTLSWDELLGWLSTPDKKKESGNYLFGSIRETTVQHKDAKGQPKGGPCTDFHRRKTAIINRSMLALDVDAPNPDFIDKMELLFGYAAVIHTTYSSSPDDPRYRVLIPLSRKVLPDEYIALARSVMLEFGEAQFDPGTVQPERYMFRPAAQYRQWFNSWVFDGPEMDVEAELARAADFEEDLSVKPMPEATKKRDPFELEGVLGAFNRAYQDLALLVEEYELPYEEAGADRWQLVGSRSVAGMGVVSPGVFYSHHANDPAFGQACTAFDLVRLHQFGALDEDAKEGTPVNRLPSSMAMRELATTDARVTAELVGLDFAAEMDDDADSNDWKLKLSFNSQGKLKDTIENWDLIAAREPVFRSLYFNELSMSVETDSDLPWRTLDKGGKTFSTTDRMALTHHIERTYRFRQSRAFLDALVDTAAQRRYVNPVKDYLVSLKWDGTSRIETSLPGVEPTPYTRMVARKCLVAAVARIFEPGCKWDHTLVLFGSEGLGKSVWIDRLSRGYSASLGRIGDKDTLLTMQRSWIMVSDEGHSLRKSDADATKEFLTRRADVFRMPYDREAQVHQRHCVIWGTTNDEVFLRRQEGNRRFLIVHCRKKMDFDSFTETYIDQLWAEAVELYEAGEQLYLSDDESELAAFEREAFVEEDAVAGVLAEYLNRKVPEGWNDKTIQERLEWLSGHESGFTGEGDEVIYEVCTAQMWTEAMGRKPGEHKRTDLLEIAKSLRELGWKAVGRARINGYGPQVVYRRTDAPEPEEHDLL